MRITDMQDAIAIEWRRQIREGEIELDQSYVESISAPPSVKWREPDRPLEKGHQDFERQLAPSAAPAGAVDPVPAAFEGSPLRDPTFHRSIYAPEVASDIASMTRLQWVMDVVKAGAGAVNFRFRCGQ